MASSTDRIGKKLRQAVRVIYSVLVPTGKRMLINSLSVKDAKIDDLRAKLDLSHTKNKVLHQKNLLLEDKNFDVAITRETNTLDKLSKLSDYEMEILDLQTQIDQLRTQAKRRPNVVKMEKLTDINTTLKTKLKRAIDFNRTYGVLIRYLSQENNLNSNAFSVVSEQKFDYVISHDILGVFAATSLASHFDCPLIVDLVEEHNLMKRSGDFFRKNLSQSDAALINDLLEKIVNSAHKQLLIGPLQYKNFTETVRKKGAALLPNYRNAYVSETENREFIDGVLEDVIGRDQAFICVPNRIIKGSELKLLIGAVAKAGVKLPIIHVGTPLTDEARIEVTDYCVKKRVKFFELGVLDYDQYREVLSRALFCSFISQETAFNVKYAFPNRLFDAVSTQTPILTTGFVQVGDFVQEKSIGVYIDGKQTIVNVSEAVKKIIEDNELYRTHLKKQSKACSWDSIFSKTFKSITAGNRVLIITRKDVRQNQRVRNLYSSFMAKGCHVTVIGGNNTEYNVLNRNFYTLPLSRAVSEEELYADE